MKALIVALFAFCMTQAFAVEIKVSRMTSFNGMERSFILKSNMKERVVLDCQSFLQGLTMGENESSSFIMMSAEDCQVLYTRIRGSLRSFQKHCIDAEDSIRSDYTCL